MSGSPLESRTRPQQDQEGDPTPGSPARGPERGCLWAEPPRPPREAPRRTEVTSTEEHAARSRKEQFYGNTSILSNKNRSQGSSVSGVSAIPCVRTSAACRERAGLPLLCPGTRDHPPAGGRRSLRAEGGLDRGRASARHPVTPGPGPSGSVGGGGGALARGDFGAAGPRPQSPTRRHTPVPRGALPPSHMSPRVRHNGLVGKASRSAAGPKALTPPGESAATSPRQRSRQGCL